MRELKSSRMADDKTSIQRVVVNPLPPRRRDNVIAHLAAPTAGAEFFYFIEESGEIATSPIRAGDFVSLLASGRVTPSTLVWAQSLGEWTALRNVPALASMVALADALAPFDETNDSDETIEAAPRERNEPNETFFSNIMPSAPPSPAPAPSRAHTVAAARRTSQDLILTPAPPALAQPACLICANDASPVLSFSAACAHALCAQCTVRQLRLELSQPGDARMYCPILECRRPISIAALAFAAAYAPAAAAAVAAPADARVLGPDALARAELRRKAAVRAQALAACAAALGPGLRARNCPAPTCEAVLVCAPSTDGSGARAVCGACGIGVCEVCCEAWSLCGLAHVGLTCSDFARNSAAAAGKQAAATVAATAVAAAADVLVSLGDAGASVKRCPSCGTGVSHFRGHGCHHIAPGKGCPGPGPCGRHFCIVCLGPWPCLDANAQGCVRSSVDTRHAVR